MTPADIATRPTLHRNPSASQLIEAALVRQEGQLTDLGALAVSTGTRTGRSPADRFIVREPSTADLIDWGVINQPFDGTAFDALWERVMDGLAGQELFAIEAHVGADPEHYLPVCITSQYAWHALCARAFCVAPEVFNGKDKGVWQVLSAPEFICIPERDGTHSEAVVIIHFAQRRILLAGMRYAGELKKALFSVQNFLLPEKDVLPMHCAANRGPDGDVCLLFGLSGTGKTTLATDPERALIGDDEHAWSWDALFNLEGGCYAKCSGLTPETDPVIHGGIRYGTLLENVSVDPQSRVVDYQNSTLTENARACFPLSHVAHRVTEARTQAPERILFLCCDLFGVLPPVAVLSPDAAVYHFLSGYSARVGATETGAEAEIEAVFSPGFGAAFLPRPPQVYADLLQQLLDDTGCRVYLVNTGWYGGPPGVGQRYELTFTRALVRAIQAGKLDETATETLPGLNLAIPTAVPGIDAARLDPRRAWRDGASWQAQCDALCRRFQDHFQPMSVTANILAAGPRPQQD